MSLAPVRSIAGLLNRWRNRSSVSPSPGLPDTGERGRRGEKLAAKFLRKHGYKILCRNFRGRTGGEIDIVARDSDTLVFVEVKTRGSENFGRPFESIWRDQQRRISRGALAWLRLLDNPDILFRFDAVEVVMRDGHAPQLELIRNAFTLSEPYIY